MKDNPLRKPDVLVEIERRATLLEQASTAGKLTVDLNCKDGRWSLGGIALVFPRRHQEAEQKA